MRDKKRFTKLAATAAFAITIILAGSLDGFAGEKGEQSETPHAGMDMPMMEEGMMSMHQEMHGEMQAMDEKLDSLVSEMEAADEQQKVDAVAAVVAELVEQRKAMHSMMMEMQPRMMEHMMKHMHSGMMSGMKQSMGDCPMMKRNSEDAGDNVSEDHSAHHPGG